MYRKMEFDSLLRELKTRRKSVCRRLSVLPEGKLSTTKRNGKTVFRRTVYDVDDSGRRKRFVNQIGLDSDLLSRLAERELLQTELRAIDIDLQAVQSLIEAWVDYDDERLIDSLPSRCARVPRSAFLKRAKGARFSPHPSCAPDVPISEAKLEIPPESIAQWAVAPYRQNSLNLESKTHADSDGVLFRSKSELLLARWYQDERIPFHYDEVVSINDRLLSPDFIVAREDGSLVYHEHWGMVNDQSYLKTNIGKLSVYAEAGIVLGVNLVVTTDEMDGGFDARKAEGLLRIVLRV